MQTERMESPEGHQPQPENEDPAENYNFVQLTESVIQVLHTIYDPEIPVDIYELGLIYEVKCDPGNNVYVKMTLTSPNCPVAESLPMEVEQKIRAIPNVNGVKLDLVFEPPWDMSMLSEAAKLELNML